MAKTRAENDSMGEMEVPAEAYYGAQTDRARMNFQISPLRVPRSFIRAMGLIKKAAAQVNMDLGLLPADLGGPIVQAAQAVADGKHDDQFVVDVFQTGSGTSTNMNTNEVIAGVANEQFNGGVRGGKTPVHPNDAVNMGQSSNDVIPTAIHVAALEGIQKRLIPALEDLHQTARRPKARAFDEVVKIGRTHLQDAVPIRLGQEFSGYAAQVQHGLRRLTNCREALAELAIGGTAVGTGINTHAEFPQRMAAKLSQDTGPAVPPGRQHLRGDGQPRRGRRGVRGAEDGRHQPVEHRQQHPLARLGPAVRDRRDQDPRAPAGQLDHARQGQPGHPRGGDDGRRAGRRQRRDDRLGQRAGLELRPQRDDAGPRLQPAPVDRPADQRRAAPGRQVRRGREVPVGPAASTAWSGSRPTPSAARSSIERSLAMCTSLAPRIGYDNAAAIAKLAYKEGINVRAIALGLVGKTPEEIEDRLGPPASAAALEQRGGLPDRPRRSMRSSTRTDRPSGGPGSAARRAVDRVPPRRSEGAEGRSFVPRNG